jgi:hypothetical protein
MAVGVFFVAASGQIPTAANIPVGTGLSAEMGGASRSPHAVAVRPGPGPMGRDEAAGERDKQWTGQAQQTMTGCGQSGMSALRSCVVGSGSSLDTEALLLPTRRPIGFIAR